MKFRNLNRFILPTEISGFYVCIESYYGSVYKAKYNCINGYIEISNSDLYDNYDLTVKEYSGTRKYGISFNLGSIYIDPDLNRVYNTANYIRKNNITDHLLALLQSVKYADCIYCKRLHELEKDLAE